MLSLYKFKWYSCTLCLWGFFVLQFLWSGCYTWASLEHADHGVYAIFTLLLFICRRQVRTPLKPLIRFIGEDIRVLRSASWSTSQSLTSQGSPNATVGWVAGSKVGETARGPWRMQLQVIRAWVLARPLLHSSMQTIWLLGIHHLCLHLGTIFMKYEFRSMSCI
jgi:hypothetical protein